METGCYFIQTERLIGQNLAERKEKLVDKKPFDLKVKKL